MKKIPGLILLFLPLVLLVSCSGSGLKGKYVNVWSYHQGKDAQSVYNFKRNGVVVQELMIKPNEKLNFKGVNDSIEGKWEMEGSNIIITLPEGSYEMELIEKGDNYIILSMPSKDGTIYKRKFVKS